MARIECDYNVLRLIIPDSEHFEISDTLYQEFYNKIIESNNTLLIVMQVECSTDDPIEFIEPSRLYVSTEIDQATSTRVLIFASPGEQPTRVMVKSS